MRALPLISMLSLGAALGAQGTWVALDGPADVNSVGGLLSTSGRFAVPDPGAGVFRIEGPRWIQRPSPTPGPTARILAGFASDLSQDRYFLFGGRRDNVYLDDLWQWDGVTWTDLTPPATAVSPPARWDGLMAYDVVRQRLVLFGGAAGASFNDTWEFDGTSWLQRSPTVVPESNGCAMAYDIVRQHCLLLTYVGIVGAPCQTYTWDANDWTLVDTQGPPRREGAGMAHDPNRDIMVLIGGNPIADEIWEWNGSSWSLAATAVAAPRYRPTVVYDPTVSGVRMFGGHELFTLSTSVGVGPGHTDGWLWDGTSPLQPLHPELRPPARFSQRLASDPFRDRLVLFGGGLGISFFGDTWTWDGDRWLEAVPATNPPERRYATLWTDYGSGTVAMFGGFFNGTFLGDLWTWDGVDWTPQPQVGAWPAARSNASLAFDQISGTSLMFGGTLAPLSSPGFASSQTWRWNGTGWTLLTPAQSPPGRERGALEFDPSSGGMLLFGGRDGYTAQDQMNDFWRFDGVNWTPIQTATQPPALFDPSLMFLPSLGQMALFGFELGVGAQVWLFDGVDWALLQSDALPSPRGPVVFDVTRQRPVAYSGAALQEWTTTPAVVEQIDAPCGAPAARLALRTRPRVGSAAFGFEARALFGDVVVFGVTDTAGSLPLFGCNVRLGGAIVADFAVASGVGTATLPLPLPQSTALRGTEWFAHAVAWNPASPLAALRTTEAWRFVIGD